MTTTVPAAPRPRPHQLAAIDAAEQPMTVEAREETILEVLNLRPVAAV